MFTLTYPPKIIFGCGVLNQLKEEAANFGENALLVTGRSAMAFSNSGLGAVHGLSHPLEAYFNIPHGLACAVLLSYILELNLEIRRDKFQEMATRNG